MSDLPPFDDMLAGKSCPFCPPQRQDSNKFWHKIASLSSSSLYLERNQAWRGYSILVFDGRHVTGLEQLTTEEHAKFSADLKQAGNAIFSAVRPDHMNYATLGNVIPHLHYHLIPRYRSDPRWGAPIWTTKLADTPALHLKEDEFQSLAGLIRRQLAL